MRLIKIEPLSNGAHNNQTVTVGFKTIPDGWAIIPDGMECINFPFGDITVEEVDGVKVVTSWTPGEIPKTDESTKDPSITDILNALLGVE